MSMTKTELLKKLPRGMRAAHKDQTVRFIRESLREWKNADAVEREDIMAFFRSDGPAKVEVARRLHAMGLLRPGSPRRKARVGRST